LSTLLLGLQNCKVPWFLWRFCQTGWDPTSLATYQFHSPVILAGMICYWVSTLAKDSFAPSFHSMVKVLAVSSFSCLCFSAYLCSPYSRAICNFPRENEELQLEQELSRQGNSKIGTT
jgi:hypothetical protein